MTLLQTVLLWFDLIHYHHFILQERVVTSTNQWEHNGKTKACAIKMTVSWQQVV